MTNAKSTDGETPKKQPDIHMDEIRRRAEELHVLHEVGQVLQTARSLDDLLDGTLRVIAELAELEVQSKLGVFLVDAERKGLKLVRTHGEFTEEFLEKEAWIPMGACLCGRAAVSGEMVLSANCFNDPRHEHTFEGMTAHGHYIIPLKSSSAVIGVMFLYTDPNPNWDDRRVKLLESVGGQIGIAIERLRSEAEIRRRSEELHVLHEIDGVIQQADSIDELLSESLVALAGLAELEVQSKLGVFLVDDERRGLKLIRTHGEFTDEFLEKEAWIPMGACLCGRSAVSGELIVSDNCFTDPRHEHTFCGMTAHGHYIIPLKFGGTVLGVIFLYTDPNPHWDQRRIGLLQAVGGQIGIAIQRLRAEAEIRRMNQQLDSANQQMKNELEAASKVQQSLLPRSMPEVEGIRFAWRFRPSTQLAGDILNVFRLDESHIGMYLLDVSGHGVAAALLSVTLSRFLSPSRDHGTLLVDTTSDHPGYRLVPPAEVAERLNRRFQMDEEQSQFFTLVYGILNITSREFRFVSAGHPGTVHVRSTGTLSLLESEGFPVGVTDEPEYEEHSLILSPGDRLYFYSDGIPEAMPPDGEEFGDARLLSTLDDHERDLDESVARLQSTVETWCQPGQPYDDVSILAMEIADAAE